MTRSGNVAKRIDASPEGTYCSLQYTTPYDTEKKNRPLSSQSVFSWGCGPQANLQRLGDREENHGRDREADRDAGERRDAVEADADRRPRRAPDEREEDERAPRGERRGSSGAVLVQHAPQVVGVAVPAHPIGEARDTAARSRNPIL